ncbi:hypothetical protein [Rhizobium sp. R339]|uniref:hypothetical protein n=1 Tax=Rhizobium sp. R339 TaxID=1764273 RepID=UPI001FD94ABC|nr:hypothetical protein [Rhizobium sp. R339]
MPRLTDADREAILEIKRVLAERPQGAATVSSTLVYEAVMDHGIRGVAEFETWHQNRPA